MGERNPDHVGLTRHLMMGERNPDPRHPPSTTIQIHAPTHLRTLAYKPFPTHPSTHTPAPPPLHPHTGTRTPPPTYRTSQWERVRREAALATEPRVHHLDVTLRSAKDPRG